MGFSKTIPDMNKMFFSMCHCSQVNLWNPNCFVFFWSTGLSVIDATKPVNICFKIIKQYLYGKMHFGGVLKGNFFCFIYFGIWNHKRYEPTPKCILLNIFYTVDSVEIGPRSPIQTERDDRLRMDLSPPSLMYFSGD